MHISCKLLVILVLINLDKTGFDMFTYGPFQLYRPRLRGYKSKREGKDQESIQSSTTPDPGYAMESANFTIRHHKREPRGQSFPSRWSQGSYK